MPEVPTYGLPTVRPQTGFAPQQGADVIGPALQRAGQRIGQASDAFAKQAIEEAQENTETNAKAASAEYTAFLTGLYSDPEKGFGRLNGKAALDALPSYVEQARARQTQISESLGPRARKLFDEAAAVRTNWFAGNVQSHAQKARSEWILQTTNAHMDAAVSDAALNWNDPKRREAALAIVAGDVKSQAVQLGMGQEWIDQTTREKQSAALRSITMQMSAYDPTRAQSFLEENRGRMDAKDVVALTGPLRDASIRVDAQRGADSVFAGNLPDAGTMTGFLSRLDAQEGRGSPGTSSALGKFQFIESTWAGLVNSAGGRGAGLTLEGRTDPTGAQQTAAMRLMVPRYTAALNSVGAPLNEKNLYMVHFMGEAGFQKFYKAMRDNPWASGADLFPEAAKANPSVFYWKNAAGVFPRSLAEIYRNQTARFPGSGTAPSAEEQHANIQVGLQQVDAIAEQQYPGDVMAREQYRAAYTSTVSQHTTDAANVRSSALSLLTKNMTDFHGSMEQFMAVPENASAMEKLGTDAQRGLGYAIQFNATLNDQGQQITAPPPVDITIDPHDTKQVEAYDVGYRALAQGWNGFEPQRRLDLGVSYARGAGVMPPSLKGEISANLRSGDPNRRIAAAGAIGQLQSANPRLLADFPQDEVSQALALRDLTATGTQPAEAARIVEEGSRAPEAVRKARGVQFDASINEQRRGGTTVTSSVDSGIASSFGTGGWFSNPRSMKGFDALRAEVINSARAQYETTGNYDAAIGSAIAVAHRTWGISEINGKSELMRGAPETLYGINNAPQEYNTAWQRGQLVRDLIKTVPVTANPEELSQNPEWIQSIELRPAVGRVDSQGRPWYQVWAGQALLVNQDGSPLLWKPDPEAEIARMKAFQGVDSRTAVTRARSIRDADPATYLPGPGVDTMGGGL